MKLGKFKAQGSINRDTHKYWKQEGDSDLTYKKMRDVIREAFGFTDNPNVEMIEIGDRKFKKDFLDFIGVKVLPEGGYLVGTAPSFLLLTGVGGALNYIKIWEDDSKGIVK